MIVPKHTHAGTDIIGGVSSLAAETAARISGDSALNTNKVNRAGNDSVSGTLTVGQLKDSGLTSGRITFADTGGQLSDTTKLTWDGTTLSVTGQIKDSGLTSGRVTFAGTGGQLSDSGNLTWSGTLLTVVGTATATTLKATDQAGTGYRMTVAGADGTLSDVDEVSWLSAFGMLQILRNGDNASQISVEQTGNGNNAVAINQNKNNLGHYAYMAAWCSSFNGSLGGVNRADSAGFMGQGMAKVFYGPTIGGTSSICYFVYDTRMSAQYNNLGWTFTEGITATADIGTGDRMLTAAAATGKHTPVNSVVWTGSALVLGTDPGGSELLRVGGTLRASGATITGLLNNTVSISGDNCAYLVNTNALGYGAYIKGGSAGRYALQVQNQAGTTLLNLDGAGALQVSGKIESYKAAAAANITDANASLKLYDSAIGAGLFGMQTSGAPYAFQLQVADPTMASRFPLHVNPYGGALILGTDPGGSELLRVGGSVRCAALTVASADYVYLRGDASTDGSVRISSPSAGTAKLEARSGGTWSNISFT